MSIFSSFGVFGPSPPESLSPLTKLDLWGGLKFSNVRLRMSPPFAVNFSRISIGGGSRPCRVLISYALLDVSGFPELQTVTLTQDFCSTSFLEQKHKLLHLRSLD